MTARPPVSVVMPFAGSDGEARAAVRTLEALRAHDGDERLLADNAGVLAGAGDGRVEMPAADGAIVIAAAVGERSPAHARNAGAAAARDDAEWILFLDADTIAPSDLIDRYFAEPIAADVGALAGGIRPAPPAAGARPRLAARYAAHKNFLDAGVHLAHPYLPRAAAANLLVRRAAFEAAGGFCEGLRAAEDTDFSWRLQQSGWRLIGRPGAVVEHRYRDSVGALRRQWRGYAAGRAWLGRRYEPFEPRPALARGGRRALGRVVTTTRGRAAASPPPAVAGPGADDQRVGGTSRPGPVPLRDRVAFAVLDGILGVEELIGMTQSNLPPAPSPAAATDAEIVLIADRYPVPGDPAHEAVARLARPDADRADDRWIAAVRDDAGARGDASVRVEAAARPQRPAALPAGVSVAYREDDGAAERWRALWRLLRRQPTRCLLDVTRRQHGIPLRALARAALRLLQRPGTTPWMLDYDPEVQLTGERLGELSVTGVASFPRPPGR